MLNANAPPPAYFLPRAIASDAVAADRREREAEPAVDNPSALFLGPAERTAASLAFSAAFADRCACGHRPEHRDRLARHPGLGGEREVRMV
jgi:hypothetical protein